MNTNFIYLDILGFKNFISRNISGAGTLLMDVDNTINAMAVNLRSSSDYFIPGSDSIFISHSDANVCVLDLCEFLYNAFYQNSALSYPENPLIPEEFILSTIGKEESGNISVKKSQQSWFPCLFRGGIYVGDVQKIDMTVVNNGNVDTKPNLFGDAVVRAIAIEQSGFKGPRILFDENFHRRLSGNPLDFIMPCYDRSNYYELNWFLHDFITTNGLPHAINNDFHDRISPAFNLWKAHNHEIFGIHYYYFMKSIVKGTISLLKNKKHSESDIKRVISDCLSRNGLSWKIDDLFN